MRLGELWRGCTGAKRHSVVCTDCTAALLKGPLLFYYLLDCAPCVGSTLEEQPHSVRDTAACQMVQVAKLVGNDVRDAAALRAVVAIHA